MQRAVVDSPITFCFALTLSDVTRFVVESSSPDAIQSSQTYNQRSQTIIYTHSQRTKASASLSDSTSSLGPSSSSSSNEQTPLADNAANAAARARGAQAARFIVSGNNDDVPVGAKLHTAEPSGAMSTTITTITTITTMTTSATANAAAAANANTNTNTNNTNNDESFAAANNNDDDDDGDDKQNAASREQGNGDVEATTTTTESSTVTTPMTTTTAATPMTTTTAATSTMHNFDMFNDDNDASKRRYMAAPWVLLVKLSWNEGDAFRLGSSARSTHSNCPFTYVFAICTA
jgi:hypothetical protein